MFKKLLLWLCVGLLAACASVPQPPKPKNVAQAQQIHANQMQKIRSFVIKGRIGVQTNTNEGGSASLNWEQHQETFHIHLSSPLGQTIFDLTGNDHSVALQTAEGEHLSAATPEALLTLKTGWHMPVTNLVYWIRGIPVPDKPLYTKYDDYGRLAELIQPPDWRIEYQDYQMVNGLALPQRMTLTSPTVKLKLLISSWQLGQ